MKKLLSLALIVMVCCSAAIMFGCTSKEGTMTISGETTNLTHFTGNEEDYDAAIDAALTKIKITITGLKDTSLNITDKTLKEARALGASIMGFSLKQKGTFTATVTLYGVSETFEYTVGTTAQNPET